MTYNKESMEGFDLEEIIQEQLIIERETTDEVNHYPHIRSNALVMSTYIETILEHCICYIVQSKKGQKIPNRITNDILLDRKIIDSELHDDLNRIFEIRNHFAHQVNLSKIEQSIEPVMEKMNVTCELGDLLHWKDLDIDSRLWKIMSAVLIKLMFCFKQQVKQENFQSNGNLKDDK